MTTTTGLHDLPLHELADQLRTRRVGSVETTEAQLERIERLNPTLNAYITVMAESALAEARAADEEIAAGRYRGALHGVPIGVKDLCATNGVLTTAGSKILGEWVPDRDATVVRRLRDAGAVIIGKTNLHEFAFGAVGLNQHFGPAHNPWDVERVTGGSSSGSGAGVAAGLCYAALGSDTGGSIRIPASLCGIVGIKATYGRVSLHDVVPLSWSLDHVGPMARSARDCAIVLGAIAGRDAADASSADVPAEDWTAGIDRGIEGLRIGVPQPFAFEHAEPDVAAKVSDALSTLEGLGAEVRHVDLPVLHDYWLAASTIVLAEAATYHREHMETRAQDIAEDVRGRIQIGLDMQATDYVRALRLCQEARRTCDDALLADLDLLAMPSTIRTAVPIDSVTKDDPTLGLTRMTAPFDLTGQPAISVPCGLTEEGLPVGLQLVGRRFDEATVLRAAHAFEASVPMSRPPVD